MRSNEVLDMFVFCCLKPLTDDVTQTLGVCARDVTVLSRDVIPGVLPAMCAHIPEESDELRALTGLFPLRGKKMEIEDYYT